MDALKLLAELTADCKIDKSFHRKVNTYRLDYLIANSEAFSTGLTGIVPLHFKTVEVSYFFEDLCGIDEVEFQQSRKKMDGVDLTRKVSSDSFNLLLTFLAHRALADKSLKEELRISIAKELYLIFIYRTLAALMSSRFSKYQATEAEAVGTYESLSNKFILKKLKSWAAYCEYRAEKMIDKKSPSYKRGVKPKNTEDFLRLATGMQTALASTFNAIFSLHMDEMEKGNSGQRSSQVEEKFGEEVVSESADGDFAKIERTLAIVAYPSFINRDVIKVISHVVTNFNGNLFMKLLENLQTEFRGKKHTDFEEYVRASLVWTLSYLRENRSKYDDDNLIEVLQFIRGGLSASRTIDQALITMRNDGLLVTSELTGKRDRQLVIVHRNALSLYLFLILRTIV